MPYESRLKKKDEFYFGQSFRNLPFQKSGRSLEKSSSLKRKGDFEQEELFMKHSIPMRKLAGVVQKLTDNILEWAVENIKEFAEPVKKRRIERSSLSDPKSPTLAPRKSKEFDPVTPILKRAE